MRHSKVKLLVYALVTKQIAIHGKDLIFVNGKRSEASAHAMIIFAVDKIWSATKGRCKENAWNALFKPNKRVALIIKFAIKTNVSVSTRNVKMDLSAKNMLSKNAECVTCRNDQQCSE